MEALSSGSGSRIADDRRPGRILWDWLRLGEAPEPADVIVVLGSQDYRVADEGVRLFLARLAPRIVFSGGRGRLTRDWPEPEAVAFARRASLLGLSDAAVLIEPDSTNTGENLKRSAALLEARGLLPRRWILVHKPYLERRARATAAKQVPAIEAFVTSPPVAYEEWPSRRFPWPIFLRSLVGTLERMIDYPRRGFQMPETIPPAVLEAGRALASRGYSDPDASALFDRGAPTT